MKSRGRGAGGGSDADAAAGSHVGVGRLVVVGTPIGNIEDLAPRAARALGEAGLVAAEDTRTARALLARLGLRAPVVSYFDGNEARRADELGARLRGGATVALVSESGLPLVSDPGYRLVRAAIDAGARVEVVPGPSAVLVALVGSGLPCDEFRFVGFPPRKGAARRERLRAWARDRATLVLFEAAPRLGATLADLGAALGDRRAVVARELTRRHEEWARGTLADLGARFRDAPPRGQVTIVVEGARAEAERDAPDARADDSLRAAVRGALGAGMTPRDLYRLATEIKEEPQ